MKTPKTPEIDVHASRVEALYGRLYRAAPRRAVAVSKGFGDVLGLEVGEARVRRDVRVLHRIQRCEKTLADELERLNGLRCGDCGERRRFVQRQTVEEIVEVDGDGEFVEVIAADTKDVWRLECYECESANVVGAAG